VKSERSPLRRLVGRGAAWSTLDVAVSRVGNFALGVAVARIVAPKEFGVFAIALVVHTVVVNISDFGVSAALIRDDAERVPASAPTIVTISLVASAALGGLVVLLSGPLARSLSSPAAATPIAIMALNLPLAGLTAVPSAMLRREFRMDRIFVADFANLAVSSVVVLVLALHGLGALALAWSWVAGQLATTLILLAYRAGRYRPGWKRAEAHRLLDFGLPIVGSNLLALLVLNVDYIVVGHVLGARALGLYMLAFNISGWASNVFGAVIRSVSMPAFARLRLEGHDMPEQFLRALRLVTGVTVPVCLIIAGLARPAVVAIYGPKWSAAASALVGLSVLGAGRILIELAGDYLVTLGRTRSVFFALIPWLAGLATTLILVARPYGIAGVGTGQAVVVVGIVAPVYGVLLRSTGVGVWATLHALAPGVAWALAAGVAAHLVAAAIGSPLWGMLVGGGVGVLVAAIPFGPILIRKRRKLLLHLTRRAAPASPSPAGSVVHS
jgi:O-antigen/teichoic acid export membrane protein